MNTFQSPSPFLLIIIFATCILLVATCTQKQDKPTMTELEPPVAQKIPKELTIHGDTRIDPYYWLNEPENPDVIDHLEAENVYREAYLKHTKKFQKKLYKEIIGRIKQDDASVPYLDNGYYYYTRYEKGKEYPIHARKEGNLNAPEEILLNASEMAKGHEFFSLRGLSVSPDNTILSYGVDTVSRRKYTLYFKDLRTGTLLADKIENTSPGVVWANDNKTLFYASKDSTLRTHKIWRHVLGTDPSEDVLIWHEEDNTFSTYVNKTKTDKYIVIGSSQTMANEYRILDADDPTGEFKLFQKRERGLEYSIQHAKDKWYILTNWNAKNFRLMQTPENKTTKRYWWEVIPHRNDAMLNDVDVFEKYLVLSERKDALRQIRIIDRDGDSDTYVDFGEEIFLSYTKDNYTYDTDILRCGYGSMTTPSTTFDINMDTGEKTLLKQEEVLGGFSSDDYVSKRLWATADDGTQVPISLVHRKDIDLEKPAPCLLRGYGSYGSSSDPYFRMNAISLLDRGFICATAHIRGGSEMGRSWYEDGKLLNKKNTFTDFIDCAEHLIAENYTNPDNLFAMGGSAGGLLMGAILNMRPDIFKGVFALVPWVDVVTTMLDESIPLTTGEFDEWGNPKNKEYYEYMLSYSPYDNVEAKDYPAIFVTTGLHDSQVQYFEPAKWVAKLRELKTDENPLLFECDMGSGHGGASGRFKRYKRTAMEYAFMLDLLGIKN